MTGEPIDRRRPIVSGLLFGTFTLLCLITSLWLDRIGAFAYIDTLFNADAPWFIRGFLDGRGTGTSWGPRSLVHPNVANLVHPFVAALGMMTGWLQPSREASIRHVVALSVCPVLAGAETVVVYRILRPLVADAGLVALIHGVLFSTVFFGAVPESYAFTGLGIALMFLCLQSEDRTGQARPLCLLATGAFLSSITITNIVMFAIVVAAHRWARTGGARRAVLDTGRTSAYGLVATAGVAALFAVWQGGLSDYPLRFEQLHEAPLLRALRSPQSDPTSTVAAQVRHYASRAAVDFPKALAYSFLPARPQIVAAQTAAHADPPIAISHQRTTPDWRRIAPVLLLCAAAGLAIPWRQKSMPLYVAALSLIGFNWCFHTFFGEEVLLYSKHWSVAGTVMLCALAPPAGDRRTSYRVVLVVLLVAVASNTLYVIWSIGDALRSWTPGT